jgi:hypothetical protein
MVQLKSKLILNLGRGSKFILTIVMMVVVMLALGEVVLALTLFDLPHLLSLKFQEDSLTMNSIKTTAPQFGVLFVHCREENMTFLNDIPSDSKLTIYETCQQTVSANYSIQYKNAGSEECTSYLDYMIQNYHDLPEINLFLQSDALKGYGRHGGHIPFRDLSSLINTTKHAFAGPAFEGFFHYRKGETWFGGMLGEENPYMRYYLNESMYDFELNYNMTNETKIITAPNACFAVHRKRILQRPLHVYIKLRDKILASDRDEARRRCCALESSWHVLLGEPPILPATSSVEHYGMCCADQPPWK